MFLRLLKTLISRFRQTSLLLVVMFVISSLICLSYSVNNASNELIKQIKNSTSAKVLIDTNLSTSSNRDIYLYSNDQLTSLSNLVFEDLNSIFDEFNCKYMDINMQYSNYGIVKSYSEINGVLTTVNEYVLQEIKNSTNINDYFYNETMVFEKYLNNQINYWQSYNLISTRNVNFSDIYYEYEFDGYGEQKKAAISLGRTFKQEEIDNGDYVCVITPNTYYYKDGNLTKVEVGDYIEYSIMSPVDGEAYVYDTYEFEVIGILNQDKMVADKYNSVTNGAIIPEKLFLEIYEKAKIIGKENSLEYSEYIYYYPCIITLNNYDEAERLVEYLKDLNNLDDKNYIYETSLDSYYAIAGNLEALSENANILFKFSIIVSILLFIFMINTDLNRRKKEVGLLRSFGEEKSHLIIEFTLQYLFIALLSLLLAIIVSIFISNIFIKDLVSVTTTNSSLMSDKILDYTNSINIIKNASINIELKDTVEIGLLEFLTITIVTILSMLRILSVKVREVLINE